LFTIPLSSLAYTPKNCALLGYEAAGGANSLPMYGTTYRSHLQRSRILTTEVRPISCLQMSVRNYHASLFNSPEERSSHLHSSGSLKWRMYTGFPRFGVKD